MIGAHRATINRHGIESVTEAVRIIADTLGPVAVSENLITDLAREVHYNLTHETTITEVKQRLDKCVSEGSLNEEAGNVIISNLIAEFNEQISGNRYHPLDYKNVGMRSWTRGDGSRHKDPGYIFIDRYMEPKDRAKWNKANPIEKFWQFLSTKGARKIGDVSGQFGSDPYSPAVVLNKLIFVYDGSSIAWGSVSRLKNSSVWRQKQQGVAENSLNEFAVDDNGGGGVDYLRVLASAWYNHDLSQLADLARQGGKPLKKIIDAQTAVEKMLARGVICPDGKTRKFYIDYNSEFNGVDMVSYAYYEHSDHDDAGNEIDDRTGKPWGPYDHLEFHGNDLGESVEQGMAEDGPGMDPTVIQMKKRAKIAHPFASSDEEALALYVADRSKKADSDIRDQQERDEQVIDRIDGAESKLEKEVARIDAILAQLSKVR
jgi:hypothetical protein